MKSDTQPNRSQETAEQDSSNGDTLTDRCRDARFEFRAWNVHDDVIGRLESIAELGDLGVMRDRYVVGPISSVNVKIRAGDVKVKRLLDVRGEFQRWCPTWKTRTPLDRVGIVRLWGEFGLPAPPSATRATTTIENLANEDQDLVVLDVVKRRRRGELDGVSVEVTSVQRGGGTAITVALEDVDLERLRVVRRLAGLDGYDNVAVHVAVAHRWAEIARDGAERRT